MNATEIKLALATKYAPPEWCLYFEVSNDTGAASRRYADAVAMSIWPSRGYVIHGFEVKVSRSDFIAEMRDPTKADAVGKFCDHWWLATPAKLVDPAEIPATWGLMELTGAGLRVKKQAPQTATADITRGFAAAMIRRGQDMQQAHISREIKKGEAAREASVAAEVERQTKELREKVAKQAEWARDFEAAFGQKPTTWERPEGFAEKIKLAAKLSGEWGAIARLRQNAAEIVKAIDEAHPVSRTRVAAE